MFVGTELDIFEEKSEHIHPCVWRTTQVFSEKKNMIFPHPTQVVFVPKTDQYMRTTLSQHIISKLTKET